MANAELDDNYLILKANFLALPRKISKNISFWYFFP